MGLFTIEDVIVFSVMEQDEAMAKGIAEKIGVRYGKIEQLRYGNGCLESQPSESVRGKFVVLVSSLVGDVGDAGNASRLDTEFMTLLFSIQTARASFAERILVVTPYNAYARSDKKDKPRIAYGFKTVAEMIENAGAWSALVCDLHNDACGGYFSTINIISMRNMFLDYARKLNIDAVAAPDLGAQKRARSIAEELRVPFGVADKKRNQTTIDTVDIANIEGVDFTNKRVLISEDEVATGATIREATWKLLYGGAEKVYVEFTHAVLCGNALENLWGKNAPPMKLITTNTVPVTSERQRLVEEGKLEVFDVSHIFGEAVRRIVVGESLSDMYLNISE